MIPFLRNRDEAAVAGPIEKIERKPDEEKDYGMLDAVAEDLLAAIEKKDKRLLKEALSAFAEHLEEKDSQQDKEFMK